MHDFTLKDMVELKDLLAQIRLTDNVDAILEHFKSTTTYVQYEKVIEELREFMNVFVSNSNDDSKDIFNKLCYENKTKLRFLLIDGLEELLDLFIAYINMCKKFQIPIVEVLLNKSEATMKKYEITLEKGE